MIVNLENGEEIINVIRYAMNQFNVKNLDTEFIDIPVDVKLWQIPGCHELLASLGKYISAFFDIFFFIFFFFVFRGK